jgi:hypothetical protein
VGTYSEEIFVQKKQYTMMSLLICIEKHTKSLSNPSLQKDLHKMKFQNKERKIHFDIVKAGNFVYAHKEVPLQICNLSVRTVTL